MEADSDSKINTPKRQELYEQLQQLVNRDQQSLKTKAEREKFMSELPASLFQFLQTRKVDISDAIVEVPRFIRIKSQEKLNAENAQNCSTILAQELEISPEKILPVFRNCFALAPSVKINRSKAYQEGFLYGMDFSSMMAVECLQISSATKNKTLQNKQIEVLELCSAPGNKSMYICDIQPRAQVTAVQINPNRANVMKSLIEKYEHSKRIKVIVEDATKFKPQDMNKKFDYVLVDAECTHQGSIKHLKKFATEAKKAQSPSTKNSTKKSLKNSAKQSEKQIQNNQNPYMSVYSQKNNWSTEDFQERFLDPVKLNNLKDLQEKLIQNGFELLKQGGVMVYSTCSADVSQNEHIVESLSRNNPNSKLLDCKSSLEDVKCPLFYREGSLAGTVYFSPKMSMCGGMFISKLTKMGA